MTVNMKIDLVGPRKRGLAMGLNEAAGYGAVGLTALLTGYMATYYGLRPEPFYIGIFYTLAGLLISLVLIRDTRAHTRLEAAQVRKTTAGEKAHEPKTAWVRSEEQTSELQSLMRISYAVFCLKKKKEEHIHK